MIFHLYLQPQASFKYFLILLILTNPKRSNNWIQAIIILKLHAIDLKLICHPKTPQEPF